MERGEGLRDLTRSPSFKQGVYSRGAAFRFTGPVSVQTEVLFVRHQFSLAPLLHFSKVVVKCSN